MNTDGDYLDLGCANGLLLESLVGWCAERGHRVTPARAGFHSGTGGASAAAPAGVCGQSARGERVFMVPPRRYRFVQLLLSTVPPTDQREFVSRVLNEMVATPGRLILACMG